ncbi:rRNA maturation RNase YbeY [Ehrlichia muris]|uniref:Endoribonuclease YbeY n=1 Tax=Ehrlichia muris AS145 TaxID=1423892 RepID=V9R768_9RICK|nr:rRNA maturation RNase YbeY [Ehrlichia muris]AHC39625.1 rRNA maturation factor [Ehrlichia muris AS145]
MIEINVYYRKWYNIINKPKSFVKNIINISLIDLNIYEYKPIISVVLANNKLLQKLNYEYRKKDKPTNVLSFPYNKLNKNCYLGEIFISLDILISESIDLNIPLEHHTSHMLIHGLLHILDYDHEEPLDQHIMESIEIKLLDKLGIKNPYVPRETYYSNKSSTKNHIIINS